MKYAPAIKWSGSKRPMAREIVSRFPERIKTYYEPFCGGASVLRRLLDTPIVRCERYVCSDLNKGLIDLWNAIKTEPEKLIADYERMWGELNADEDLERKKRYFASVRARYNDEIPKGGCRASDFLFIMRTCTNGMPRYNAEGKFNNSFHVTRPGIEPKRLREILSEWSRVLNANDVQFVCRSYDEIEPECGDFVFLDPPYAGTKGMYFGGFDIQRFLDWLGSVKCGYALTFDGKAGNNDQTYDVPKELYDTHEYLNSGNSSFRRVIGTSRDTIVYESLYMKGER